MTAATNLAREPLGAAALVVLALLLLTGIGLASHYTPTTDLAYDSIRALEHDVAAGAFTRALHLHGATALALVLLAQLVWMVVVGAYRGGGRSTWWTLLALLFLTLLYDITGQLLPMDERAWAATTLRAGIAADLPGAGPAIADAALGGAVLAGPTVLRFYVFHLVVLPAATVLLLALHLRRRTPAGPAAASKCRSGARLLLVLLVPGLAAFTALHIPAPLGAPHAPGLEDFAARPEWYMLWMNQLLELLPGSMVLVATAVLPALLTCWFVAVPWIDRDGLHRRLVRGVGAVLLVLLAGLSIPGALHEVPARPVPTPPLGMSHAERGGFLLLRSLRCMECHHWRLGEQVFFYGDQEQRELEAPDLFDIEVETEEDMGAFLDMTIEGDQDMPSYELVGEEQLRSIALFLRRMQSEINPR